MGAMELEEKTVQIRDDFDPDKILESGQCFRPRKQAEGWYRFVSGGQLLYLRPLRSGTYTVRCEPGAWETFWHGYFDLGRSYAALRGKLDSRDDFLQRAMEYGRGIRVLRQDEWEMLVSFIISQRKSIPAGAAGVRPWLPHPLRAACGAAGGRGHTGPEEAGFPAR